MLYAIIIIIIIFFIGLTIYIGPSNPQALKKYTDRKYISNAELEDLISLIDKCPKFLLNKMQFELFYMKRSENIIIEKALKEKMNNNNISKDYYLQLTEKCKNKDLNEIPLTFDDFIFFKSFELRGIHFYEIMEKLILEANENDEVYLIAEPHNSHDSEAIKVIWNDFKVGYVPSESTYHYHKFLNLDYKAYIFDIQYNKYNRIDCIITFYIKN